MAIATISAPTRGTYNGKPTLSLPGPGENSKPITFGVARWRAILAEENLKAVRAFVDDHKPPAPEASAVRAEVTRVLRAAGLNDAQIAAALAAQGK